MSRGHLLCTMLANEPKCTSTSGNGLSQAHILASFPDPLPSLFNLEPILIPNRQYAPQFCVFDGLFSLFRAGSASSQRPVSPPCNDNSTYSDYILDHKRSRGFIMSGLNEVLEAAEIAISRIGGEEHLIQGMENLSKMNSGGLERVSAEQASALMFAAERGDSKVVKLLDEAIWTARTWDMSMSDDLSLVADRYDEEFLRPSPWRANVIDKAAVTVKGGWDKLSWQAKFALVAALGVGGTGTAVPSALGGAAGVRQAIKSGDKSYVLP